MVPALSLRLRLTLLWTAVSLVVLVGLEVVGLAVLGAQLGAAVDRDLARDAGDYQRAVAGASDVQDLESRARAFLRQRSDPGAGASVAYYRIRLGNGTVLTNSTDRGLLATIAATSTAPGRPATVHDGRHGDLRVAAIPIVQGGRRVGDVRIAAPLRGVQDTVRGMMLPLLAAGAALIAVTGVAAYVLIGRGLRPVRRITATAAGIGESALGRRIDYRGPSDEVGELAATFDDMLGRLERGFQQRRAFYALASHELRTPLTIVRGHLEVLRRDPHPAPEDVREALDVSLEELGRITGDVDDMLLLGRMLLGQPGPLATCDGAALIAGVHRRARRLAARDWRLDAPAPVPIEADAEQLERALLNLVANAARHTAGGDLVTLSCRAEGGWARLRVADTGEGIAEEDVPRIFEPWYRAGRRRGEVGGLGLMIVREVVRAHRGRIDVASRPGVGTAFDIRLPLVAHRVSRAAPLAAAAPRGRSRSGC